MSDATHLIVAITALIFLSGCDYTIGMPLTTPVERAAGQYIGCSNYWRLHTEQEQDMKDMSAFIGCKYMTIVPQECTGRCIRSGLVMANATTSAANQCL